MMESVMYEIKPIGFVRSGLTDLADAPKQGREGAPNAWIDVDPTVFQALDGIFEGDDIIVMTWFHKADRGVLQVHPRGDASNPLKGVFCTRSPDRPNPVGLHRVTVVKVKGNCIQVGPLEAIDKTPVVDIKPVLKND